MQEKKMQPKSRDPVDIKYHLPDWIWEWVIGILTVLLWGTMAMGEF